MKKLALITDVDFWILGAGHRVRISALINYLVKDVDVTVLFIGRESDHSETELSELFNINFIYVHNRGDNSTFQNLKIVESLFFHSSFDFCIIEYINNYYFLEVIPDNVITILDTHDIFSDRSESFKKFMHGESTPDIPESVEYSIYECFDYLMLICEDDYNKVGKRIAMEKLLLVPYSTKCVKKRTRAKVSNVTFLGSEYLPNIDAIKFFIENIWSQFAWSTTINLNIYGNVCRKICYDDNLQKGVLLKGYASDLRSVYDESDIIINPVRFGAGMKIKNIEALAHGLPLITTTHGARGLSKGAGSSFFVADSIQAFTDSLTALSSSFTLRKKFSEAAHSFIEANFDEDKSFSSLSAIVNQ